MAGGIGNGIEQVSSTVEFLDLAKKKKWDLLASLKKPRCCWPQLGFLGSSNNDLLILSGEETPSKSVESFNLTSEAWNIERNLLMKRSRSRAIFADTNIFSDKCAAI